MKRFTTLYILALTGLACMAQSVAEFVQSYRLDENYVCGDGYGATYEEARDNALNDLIGKISVSLASNTNLVAEANTENGESTYSTSMKSDITTYSNATLTNVKSITIDEAPNFHVFRYISRDELQKVYAQRQTKITSLVSEARKALDKRKIDDALRYYYWSYVLVRSLQYPDESYYNLDGDQVHLMTWIPQQIDDIFDSLNVDITEMNEDSALLYFTYEGESVRGLDFSFWNGTSLTPTHHVKDGIGEIEFRKGYDPSKLLINYEYKYQEIANNDDVLATAITLFGYDNRHSQTALKVDSKGTKLLVSKDAAKTMASAIAENNDLQIETIKDYKPYSKSIETVMKAITAKTTSQLRPLFTDDGWEMMDRLLHFGKAKVLGKQEYSFYELNDGRVCCRSITMSFAFPTNHKTFTEDVVFTFNDDKLIEGVTFGLGTEAKNDVFLVGKDAQWDETTMLAIVDFLENYKTAFALKRTDYIESIFDDNAYIVTGHVVKKAPQFNDGMALNLDAQKVEYTQYTKDEYIKKLRNIFAKNEYVNIHFSDNQVTRMPKGGDMFGIQIHQDYYSQHYGDTGYLFLAVDLNDPKQPIIKVRTWQPERTPGINNFKPENPAYGLIGPYDFQ